MSPRLEENLCHAAVTTGSYETASETAGKWINLSVSPSVIHAHVACAAKTAGQQREDRVAKALDLRTRHEVAAEAEAYWGEQEFSLVIMLDGWMRRERGVEWGLKPDDVPGARVEWKETKSAIIFRLDGRLSKNGRPMITEKFYVSWHGNSEVLSSQLYAEALRRGLQQATKVYVVADGAVWIWNLIEDRFSWCEKELDFYHASQHMWAIAHELHGDGPEARQWVSPMLHELRHGGESGVIQSLEDLLEISAQFEGSKQEVVRREVDYFRKHKDHIHYNEMAARGCPVGSGAMESTCAQFQTRFKRTGQFWTTEGFQNLMDLEVARRNRDWDQIWKRS